MVQASRRSQEAPRGPKAPSNIPSVCMPNHDALSNSGILGSWSLHFWTCPDPAFRHMPILQHSACLQTCQLLNILHACQLLNILHACQLFNIVYACQLTTARSAAKFRNLWSSWDSAKKVNALPVPMLRQVYVPTYGDPETHVWRSRKMRVLHKTFSHVHSWASTSSQPSYGDPKALVWRSRWAPGPPTNIENPMKSIVFSRFFQNLGPSPQKPPRRP